MTGTEHRPPRLPAGAVSPGRARVVDPRFRDSDAEGDLFELVQTALPESPLLLDAGGFGGICRAGPVAAVRRRAAAGAMVASLDRAVVIELLGLGLLRVLGLGLLRVTRAPRSKTTIS